jgi:hypothetical protein
VNACVSLTGEAARTCYAREVALELAAVGGTAGTETVPHLPRRWARSLVDVYA